MKRRSVAALLSALVFPGAGQYYLGRKKRGLLLAAIALACGWIWLNYQIDIASGIAEQVLGGAMALDPAAIEAKVAAQATPLRVTVSGSLFLLSWAASILEVFLAPKG